MGYDSRRATSDPAWRLRYYDDRSLARPETSHWGSREMSCPLSHVISDPTTLYVAAK